jgi:hypothetical protein
MSGFAEKTSMPGFTIKATEQQLEALCQEMKDIAEYAEELHDECDPSHSDYQTSELNFGIMPLVRQYSGNEKLEGSIPLFYSLYDAFGISITDGEGSCDLPTGTNKIEVKNYEEKDE